MNYKSSKYNFVLKRGKNSSIVLNSKTGIISEIETNTLKNMKNNTFADEPNLNELIESGFVVDENINETNRVLIEEKQAILNQYPENLFVVIAPTMKCNLRCIYCFEENCNKTDDFNDNSINSILFRIEEKIKSNPNLKRINIRWFGGEPLLQYNNIVAFSKKAVSLCDKYKISYKAQITTNGVLLTKEKALVLKNECKIDSCQITLDGTEKNYCYYKNATPKQFKQVIQNIIDCNDIFRIDIRLNADLDNFEDLKNLTKYLLVDLKLKDKVYIYLAELKSVCENKNYTKEQSLNTKQTSGLHSQFVDFMKNELCVENMLLPTSRPKSTFCGFIKHYNLVIGPKAELYRCEHSMGREDKIIGDCKNGLYYNSYELSEFDTKRPSKCLKCNIFPMCLSGCPDERKHIAIDKNFCKNQRIIIKNNILVKLKQSNIL